MHMLKTLLAAAIGAAALLTGPSGHGQSGFTLKSVSVELPVSERMFPTGPNVDVVNANCLTCHSVGMVLYQPALSRAAWESEVHKMIDVYKAPIAAGDVAPIVAYLAATEAVKP